MNNPFKNIFKKKRVVRNWVFRYHDGTITWQMTASEAIDYWLKNKKLGDLIFKLERI